MLKMKKFTTNTLQYYANQYMHKAIDEEEIDKIDMTSIFYQEIEAMINEDEIIIINVNAKMGLGKSTLGMVLGKHIHTLLKEKNKSKGEFSIKNVARDERDFQKLFMKGISHTVIVIDESNLMEQSGVNSSTEERLRADVSNRFRQKYVHTIWCSPQDCLNPNADILLEIVGHNRKQKITQCKLYYRLLRAGTLTPIPLGYITINVSPLINNWENNVKKIFYKNKKTKKEKQYIQEQRRKDWYVDYVWLKEKKLDLLQKHKIFQSKELDYSEIILKVVTELKELIMIQGTLTYEIIKNYTLLFMEQEGLPTSLLGEELIPRKAKGILDSYKSLYKINTSLSKLQKKIDENKIDLILAKMQKIRLQKALKVITDSIQMQESRLKKHIQLKKELEEFTSEYKS